VSAFCGGERADCGKNVDFDCEIYVMIFGDNRICIIFAHRYKGNHSITFTQRDT
jgi:hypothetical protein